MFRAAFHSRLADVDSVALDRRQHRALFLVPRLTTALDEDNGDEQVIGYLWPIISPLLEESTGVTES